LKSQVIWVPEGTFTLVPSMSVSPVFFSLTMAPVRKLVPARSVMLTEPLFTPLLGVIPATVGGGHSTENPPARVALWPSWFST
jgi:hypothetical protein